MEFLIGEDTDGHQEHPVIDGAGIPDFNAFRTDEEAHPGLVQTLDLGEFSQDLDFSDLFLEEGIFGSSAVDKTSFDAAIDNIEKSKRRGLTKRQTQVSFSEDDFDDPAQRKAFILLRHYKNQIFKAKAKPAEIFEATSFIFGRSQANELNFDLCCDVLNARRDVLRLRFHYEFFLKWMIFPFEFPFMTDPLPSVVENEILMHVNEGARALAILAWMQPGISTADLYAKAKELLDIDAPNGISNITAIEMKRWLESMEDRQLMSRMNDSWYLTGRNPLMSKIASARLPSSGTGGNVSWSKLW